jgi:hypothetical protein
MREKSACAALKRTPDAHGGAAPALDHLPIARRSARANDHAAKTLLFEVPSSILESPKGMKAMRKYLTTLPRRSCHRAGDHNGRADHVSGSLFAFGASGH